MALDEQGRPVRCSDVEGFDDEPPPCERAATVRVTVTGTNVKGFGFDCVDAPMCDGCARIRAGVVRKYYPAGTFDKRPIE